MPAVLLVGSPGESAVAALSNRGHDLRFVPHEDVAVEHALDVDCAVVRDGQRDLAILERFSEVRPSLPIVYAVCSDCERSDEGHEDEESDAAGRTRSDGRGDAGPDVAAALESGADDHVHLGGDGAGERLVARVDRLAGPPRPPETGALRTDGDRTGDATIANGGTASEHRDPASADAGLEAGEAFEFGSGSRFDADSRPGEASDAQATGAATADPERTAGGDATTADHLAREIDADDDGAGAGQSAGGFQFDAVARDDETIRTLLESAGALVNADDAVTLAETIVTAAERILGYDLVAVHLLDDGALVPVAVTEPTRATVGEPRTWDAGTHPAGDAIREDRPVEIDGDSLGDGDGDRLEAAFVLPLGDRGTLSFAATSDGGFDDGDRRVAELLAANATVALDRIDRLERLERLHHATQTMLDAGSPREVAKRAVDAATSILDYDTIAFYLHQEQRDGRGPVLDPVAWTDERHVADGEPTGLRRGDAPWEAFEEGRVLREEPGIAADASGDVAGSLDDPALGDAGDGAMDPDQVRDRADRAGPTTDESADSPGAEADDEPADDENGGTANRDPGRTRLWVPIGDHGLLEVATQRGTNLDETDVQIAQLLATNTARTLDRVERTQELERYQSVFETVSDMVYVLDAKGFISDCTPALARRLGYRRSELLGKHVSQLVDDDALQEIASIADRLLSEPASAARTQRIDLQTTRGEQIPVQIDVSLLPGEGYLGLVGTIREISDLLAVREQLSSQQDRFEYLFENIPDPVVETNHDDGKATAVSVNPAFVDTFGFDADELRDRPLNDVIVPEEHRHEADLLDEQLAEGEIHQTEIERETQYGVREFLFRGVPYTAADGTQRAFAIYTDITDQRERERHLDVLQRILRHNVRNDVNVLLGGLDKFEKDGLDEATLETLEASANDLLSMSKKAKRISHVLEADREQLETLDLTTITRDVIEEYRDAEGEISSDLPPSCPIVGSRTIARAIEELVGNAVEHAGEEPTIEITVEVTGQRASVTVADDGPGIPEQERTVLQEDEITPVQHGSGLGLWLVKHATTASGGTISFDKQADGGSVTLSFRRGEATS